ncbi:hypothetical protein EVJ58_g8072 [Rhodofomes roseus]|uniref:Uncharacterized protein n=1 Tax=Rhodofomes roseus TaxID=34475 RepID=A0A4Y9Y1D0_9APHY|nr:hypothetical protein EVJ58_g8072 [Rhodofomes roseus]
MVFDEKHIGMPPRKPRAAKWYVKKKASTVALTKRSMVGLRRGPARKAAGARRAPPSLSVQAAAQIKHTSANCGRPRKPSQEEVEELTERWETVRIQYNRQAREVQEAMQDEGALNIPSGGGGVGRNDRETGDRHHLGLGGLACQQQVAPRHVLILRDEYPTRPYHFFWPNKLFQQTTHVAFEPMLHEIYAKFPAKGLKSLFPRVRCCGIQIMDAMITRAELGRAVQFVRELLSVLDKLVVSIYTGAGWYCCRDAPIWLALRALAKTQPKLVVLPHQVSFTTEWEKLVTDGEETIWDAQVDEDECEKLPTKASREENWNEAFFGSARWLSGSRIHVDEKRITRYKEETATRTAALEDKLRSFLDDLTVPGVCTPLEDLEAMFPLPPDAMDISVY